MKNFFTGLIATTLLATTISAQAFAATAPSISLIGGGSQQINSTFSIEIREDSGTSQVNVVTAKIGYDTSKLQFVGFDASGSAFDKEGDVSTSAGNLSYGRGLAGATVTGSKKVGAVTFKAIAGSGSATVAIGAGSKLIDPTIGQNIWTGNADNAAVSFATPATTTPTPANGGTSTPTPSGNSTSTNTATAASSKTTASTTGGSTKAGNNGAVAGDATTATANSTAGASADKKDASSKLDTVKAVDSKKAKGSSATWFWLLAVLAVAAGIAVARTMRTRAAIKTKEEVQKSVAAKQAETPKSKGAKSKTSRA